VIYERSSLCVRLQGFTMIDTFEYVCSRKETKKKK